MSQFYACDRCRKPIDVPTTLINLPLIAKSFDVCDECYLDFREFMSEKGNVHLFKRPFPIDFDRRAEG